ncbi:MAG: hypothetical protein FJW79_09345 [Actinobacteria bacterium]|nr:hypothetical protein [Actinomycetota bacterium]
MRKGLATLAAALLAVLPLSAVVPARAVTPGVALDSAGPAEGPRVQRAAVRSGSPGPLVVTVRANGRPAGRSPGPSIETGTRVAWSYEVTNGGSTNLRGLSLWHNGVGAAGCPDRPLAPGETVRCGANSLAGLGAHRRAVLARAADAAGAEARSTVWAHYQGVAPGSAGGPVISLQTFVAGSDADAPPGPVVDAGSTIEFRYVVRNKGTVDLWGLWVRDDAFGDIACPTRRLEPGGKVVCVVRRAASAGVNAASAEARAWAATGAEVGDSDRHHYIGATAGAAVDIEALVEGFDGDFPPGPRLGRPGETIRFTYVVTNVGRRRLAAVRVTDDARGAVTCPARRLAVGEAMTCRATTVARLGEFASSGRVTASAVTGAVTDADPVYYHVREEPRVHQLAFEVTVKGKDADAPPGPNIPAGGMARFVYTITYTGNNIVYNVTIQDPFVPASRISCDGDRKLVSGETLRCTARAVAKPGPYASLVTVVSWDADGRRVTAQDWVHYYGMA